MCPLQLAEHQIRLKDGRTGLDEMTISRHMGQKVLSALASHAAVLQSGSLTSQTRDFVHNHSLDASAGSHCYKAAPG